MKVKELGHNPDVLPGDIVKCRETGALLVIQEYSITQGRLNYTADTLPGYPHQKHAWWDETEFEMVEKGLTHKYYREGLDRERVLQEERDNSCAFWWVSENYHRLKEEKKLNNHHITTLLDTLYGPRDYTGYMMRGEIGLATLEDMQLFSANQEEFEKMISDLVKEGPADAQ